MKRRLERVVSLVLMVVIAVGLASCNTNSGAAAGNPATVQAATTDQAEAVADQAEQADHRFGGLSADWRRFAAEADYEQFIRLLNSVSKARKQYEFNVSIQAIVEQLLLSFIGEIKK